MPRPARVLLGALCLLGLLVVLGMQWVHADWDVHQRIIHFGIALALAGCAYLCLRRPRRAGA
jgi:hypothetical protein